MASKKTRERSSEYAIVVGIDLAASGGEALAAALGIAASRSNARIHAVHSMDATFSARSAKNIAKLASLLDRAAKALRIFIDRSVADEATRARIVAHVRRAAPVDAILQLAVDVDADLIVVGTAPRKGLASLAHSSVSSKVLKLASCAVLLARPKKTPRAPKTPRIEPACEGCRAKRAATGGAEWWCDRHATRAREGAHVYSYSRELSLASHHPPGGA